MMLGGFQSRSGEGKNRLTFPGLSTGSSSRGGENEMTDSSGKIELEGDTVMVREISLGEVNWLHLEQDMTRNVLLCVR
jgi:hypothetical protein